MRRNLWTRIAVCAVLIVPLACNNSAAPIAPSPPPEASERLAVSVLTRRPVAGERLPVVRVLGAPSALAVQVTRPAFCATLAEAAVSRAPGEIAVVARVGGDPAALCTGEPFVVEYGGLVTGLAAGRYRVRVYEGVGDRPARLLSIASVTILPAAS